MAKKQLQEMDVAAGTKQSKTAVNANAKPADPMDTSVAGSVEDLGGPTPMNYKPDDDSAKLKTPGGTLKQVKDVVNSKAKPAEPMKGGMIPKLVTSSLVFKLSFVSNSSAKLLNTASAFFSRSLPILSWHS